MSEVQDIRNQLPGENAAEQGIEIDPEDLEKGKIQKTINPSKLSAQLKDARAQREHNFLQKHTGATRTRGSRTSRLQSISQTMSRASSNRQRRRASTWAPDQDVAPLEEEDEPDEDPEEEAGPGRPSTSRRSGGPLPGLTPIREGENEPAYVPDDQFMDDAASLTTLGDGEMPEKEIEPIVENIIEEEVHNHHTSWSVVRTHYREFLGELLGVGIILAYHFFVFANLCLLGYCTIESWLLCRSRRYGC